MPSSKEPVFFRLPADAVSATITLLAGCIIHFIALVLYRLYLHPLARFPGPKLAAATGWYETYHQLFNGPQGGQFIFVIEELHKQYGKVKMWPLVPPVPTHI
jgi:hypothetical protein